MRRRAMQTRRLALALIIALVVPATTSCAVRVRPGGSAAYIKNHPDQHAHQHCHSRGGKHDKRVCHSHPHGPGHH